jgi:hypothetical protein
MGRKLAVVLVLLLMSANIGHGAGASSSSQIGRMFRNGPYKFKVTGVRCDISWVGVGNSSLGKHPIGQYCRVSISYTNVSNIPVMIPGYYTVRDLRNKVYAFDTIADIYANAGTMNTNIEVNPGYGSTYRVFFDIPKGDSLKSFEFCHVYGSPGTEVRL